MRNFTSNLLASPNTLEKQKRLTFREAIFLLVGLVAGGGASAAYLVEKASTDQPKKPGIAKVSSEQGGDSGTDSKGKFWPKHWIPADEFDKRWREFNDILQCRDLVLNWDGSVVSDDEVVERAYEIEKERRLAAAEDLIADFCLSDPKVIKAIREACLKGYTKFDSLVEHYGDYTLQLEGVGKYSREFIELKKKPDCRPPLNEEEKKALKRREEEKKKLKMFKEGGQAKFLEGLDIKDLRREINAEGLEAELSGLVDWAQKLKNINKKTTQLKRIKLACEFMSYLISLDQGGGLTAEEEERVRKNSSLNESIEQLGEFSDLLLESNGVEGYEECLLHMHGITSQ